MNTLANIYTIRNELESCIAVKFTELGMNVVTRSNQPENFQQIRPRIEIKASVGSVTGHQNLCPDGIPRYDTYRVTVAIQTVVSPESDGINATNENFVGNVRAIISSLAQYSFDDTTNFPNLYLAIPFKDSGTTDTLKTEEGIEYSTLSFDSIVAIRQTAWPTT